MAIPLLTACIGLAPVSILGLIGYIFLCIGMTAVIYRFFCTHCPHYARHHGKTKCMFFWGLPGFFKKNPAPYGPLEKWTVIAGSLIVAAFPLGWLRLQPGLLAIYGLSVVAVLATIRRSECRRCIHFQCPANDVPDSQRQTFPQPESS